MAPSLKPAGQPQPMSIQMAILKPPVYSGHCSGDPPPWQGGDPPPWHFFHIPPPRQLAGQVGKDWGLPGATQG